MKINSYKKRPNELTNPLSPPFQRLSALEKGQSVATWEAGTSGVTVRPRKPTPTSAAAPGIPTTISGNGSGPTKPIRRQSLLSVAWTDPETGRDYVMWKEIDRISRIVFPLLFLVFATLYWPLLLLKSS